MPITYVQGDATRPQGSGQKIIAHVCNNVGGWGAGFVLAVSKRWSEPEAQYRDWHRRKDGFELGAVLYVKVEPDLWVANMLAQVGYGPRGTAQHRTSEPSIPLRYEALETCLSDLRKAAEDHNASVHMPRIGCGLAGGTWDRVEPIIAKTLGEVPVTVYDLTWYQAGR